MVLVVIRQIKIVLPNSKIHIEEMVDMCIKHTLGLI